jgi:hypothetical protein
MLTVSIMLCCCVTVVSGNEKLQKEKPQKIEFVIKKGSDLVSTRGKETIGTFAPPSRKTLTGLRDLEYHPVDENDIAEFLKPDPARKEPILIGIILLAPERTTAAHLDELMELYVRNNRSLVPVRVTFYIEDNARK